jgi:hypothetical protein
MFWSNSVIFSKQRYFERQEFEISQENIAKFLSKQHEQKNQD